mmetsp:Transcript_17975/g.27051  ORF Transcript_17975/g.27051 Transcript_17975/m.27051 type:complete len:289 (-) Transcript_17975:2432-3298(-)
MSVVSPLQPADAEPTFTSGVTIVRPEKNARDGFELVGSRYTVLNKQLAPNESFVAESGAMMHMSSNITMSAFWGGFSSALSGESLARVRFENKSSDLPGYVGLTPNQPMAVIIPVNLDAGSLSAKRGAYFAGPESVRPHATFLPTRSCLACCCGGLPPVVQSIQGRGTAFLAAGGTVICKTLDSGEELIVDTHSLVAFSSSIAFDVKRVGTCTTTCLGGEGCFNTVLRGPGYVYIQSVSYEKLIDFLVTPVPAGGNSGNGKKDKKSGGHHHHHHGGCPPAPDCIDRRP